MADNISKISDMLSAPMEEVIVALATGIARAQRELDRYAIEAQREIVSRGIRPRFDRHGYGASLSRRSNSNQRRIRLSQARKPAVLFRGHHLCYPGWGEVRQRVGRE